MKYPVGPAYRMLLLTGLRLNECAKLSWPEVHGDTVIIPAERMKGKNGRAREHLVPLVVGGAGGHCVTAALPGRTIPVQLQRRRAPGGDGQLRPSAIWTGACSARSRRWPAVAARIMTAVTLPNWTNHDLRRVVRSGLSQLRVPHNVAEAVLAHKATRHRRHLRRSRLSG